MLLLLRLLLLMMMVMRLLCSSLRMQLRLGRLRYGRECDAVWQRNEAHRLRTWAPDAGHSPVRIMHNDTLRIRLLQNSVLLQHILQLLQLQLLIKERLLEMLLLLLLLLHLLLLLLLARSR